MRELVYLPLQAGYFLILLCIGAVVFTILCVMVAVMYVCDWITGTQEGAS